MISTSPTILPLHTDGPFIKDPLNQTIYLRGVNWLECGYTVSSTGTWFPNGDWMWGPGYRTFSEVGMNQRLSEMHSYGFNALRLCIRNDWWASDSATTFEGLSTNIHVRDSLMRTIRYAATQDIYVILDFGFGSAFTNQAAFVTYWTNVANEYKNEPNVLFELWGEPVYTFSTWLSATKAACAAIRGTGASNLIIVQYGYCGSFDFVDDCVSGTAPTVQSYGGIVYSNHIYRYPYGATFAADSGRTTAAVESTLRNTWSYGSVIGKYPMYIGETGAWEPYFQEYGELEWFASLLSVLNSWGASYTPWNWGQGTGWALSDYQAPLTPTQSGQILVNAIAAG
jgi:hypothetical protein